MSTYRFFSGLVYRKGKKQNWFIGFFSSGPVLESGENFWNRFFFLWLFLLTWEKFPEIGCFVDTGSGAVIHVRNFAYPIKKMSTNVVFQISDSYTVDTLLVRSFL